ncbi:MAG: hypothetical protein JXA46_18720 [Dehalococcoidales bacterium]|nr:hypothetical protein [Dehalococcoidales bacterium]
MGKYDKYICTKLFKRDMLPGPTPEERDKMAAEGKRISMEHVLWIDDDIIPGAYYGESTWIWPQSYPNQISLEEQLKRTANPKPMFPHAHDFPEILSWWGTDPDHPEDTSTMGMLLDDEEIRLDTSWVAYIPAGMMHMPTRPHEGGRITSRPVCHWTSGPGAYVREKDEKAAASEKELEAQRAGLPTNIKRTGDLKNAKYVVYGYKPDAKRPAYMSPIDTRYMRPVAYIDDEIVPGAEFGCDTLWLLPGYPDGKGQMIMDKHTLSHGTSITITAMNYADITDLCAEVEFWIGGEKHIINKGFGAYIPPDVEQGPLIIRNIKSQIFFMMSQPVGEGIIKYRGK